MTDTKKMPKLTIDKASQLQHLPQNATKKADHDASRAQTTSLRGVEFIKQHEGLRLDAYQDPVGVWTIGWGHTRHVRSNKRITLEDAQKLLALDLADAERCVRANVLVEIDQSQFDALVSFVFNLGCGSLRRSTLLKLLNANAHSAAAKEFTRWNRAGGRVLAGLTRRREDEQMLFRESEREVSS